MDNIIIAWRHKVLVYLLYFSVPNRQVIIKLDIIELERRDVFMKIQNLKYMMVVAQEKSITKAANKLFIAQPALSQIIKQVEKEVGASIFVRNTSGVTLTEEGRIFLDFAENVARDEYRYKKRIEEVRSNAAREVRVGLTGTQGTYSLPYFLPQFKKKYPMARVTLVENNSGIIERKILDGTVDIGLIHPPIQVDGLENFEISHDDFVIIPTEQSHYQRYIYYREGDDRPYLDLKFLQDEPIAITTPQQRSRRLCDEVFLRAGIEPRILQESKNLITLDALAQVNYATVLLPRKQLSAELKRRAYFFIDPKYAAYYPLYVSVAKGAYRSSMTEKLLAFLRSLIYTF
ncbi:MAG: LysR family transcriptional regulator [Acidaminococcus sp.]|jgi:DNA-binding transcriptional LysR family regulator|nr:LysR family transcriptional regulator [Acidaminococcus sp.]MCI2100325.1 LysR family transcriptional regulator [Acidaminococcus sp.]MCI2114646.1 LysR family transcriptional regulator [Acidaminococcus sp.]MCI2116702.1 LysR family transcriptional regulator [Acidaminococcus sp.]